MRDLHDRFLADEDASFDERLRNVFLPAILHGDADHQAWLREAVEAFINGQPIPAPRGKGTALFAEALQADQDDRVPWVLGLGAALRAGLSWLRHRASFAVSALRASIPSADDFDRFEDFGDEGEDEFFDCHMGPDGYCGAAGSEWCEFDCPYRRDA